MTAQQASEASEAKARRNAIAVCLSATVLVWVWALLVILGPPLSPWITSAIIVLLGALILIGGWIVSAASVRATAGKLAIVAERERRGTLDPREDTLIAQTLLKTMRAPVAALFVTTGGILACVAVGTVRTNATWAAWLALALCAVFVVLCIWVVAALWAGLRARQRGDQ